LKKSSISDIIRDVFAIHTMSKTYRNTEGWHNGAIRYPHTENERKQLDGVLHDPELMELPVSGLNHMRAREHQLPSAWNDKVISAYYEV
jgi:hypothetical protein